MWVHHSLPAFSSIGILIHHRRRHNAYIKPYLTLLTPNIQFIGIGILDTQLPLYNFQHHYTHKMGGFYMQYLEGRLPLLVSPDFPRAWDCASSQCWCFMHVACSPKIIAYMVVVVIIRHRFTQSSTCRFRWLQLSDNITGLCRRRGWRDPMYEIYPSSSGYTCLVLVNGREYQTDLTYESDILAQENAAMRAFMVCRNFSVNGGMLARNGVVQGLPANEGSGRHRKRSHGGHGSSHHSGSGGRSRHSANLSSGSSTSSEWVCVVLKREKKTVR